MPISQFGKGLQNVVYCMPGTYATSLMRNHAMNGAFKEMLNIGIPKEAVKGIKASVDANITAFDKEINIPTMYGILIGTIVLLIVIYVLINCIKRKEK